MDSLFKSYRKLLLISNKERRQYARKACFIETDYRVQGRCYKGSIQNLGEGGAYVRSGRRFFPGEAITMTIPLKALGGQLKGRIVWVGSHGLGIEFQTPETGRKALPEEGCTSEREYREMGKIKGRKVRWEPSSTPDVTYRLYWSIGGGVDYHSDHVDVGNATEIVLPKDIPSFPMASDRFELGISAINQAGNESELIKAVVHVDFTVPDAPKNLMVEDI